MGDEIGWWVAPWTIGPWEWYNTMVQKAARELGLPGGRALSEQDLNELKGEAAHQITVAAAGNKDLAREQIAKAGAAIDAENEAWKAREATRVASSWWGSFTTYLPLVLIIVAAFLVIKVVADVKTVTA